MFRKSKKSKPASIILGGLAASSLLMTSPVIADKVHDYFHEESIFRDYRSLRGEWGSCEDERMKNELGIEIEKIERENPEVMEYKNEKMRMLERVKNIPAASAGVLMLSFAFGGARHFSNIANREYNKRK